MNQRQRNRFKARLKKKRPPFIHERKGDYRFRVELPPKYFDGEPRIRFYLSKKAAAKARKDSWGVFRDKERAYQRSQADKYETQHHAPKCNDAEQSFIQWAGEDGIEVQRNGWPDFLVVQPDGSIAGVEVKSENDYLSADQHRCHRLLNQAGLKTYVWHTRPGKKGKTLIPYAEYVKPRGNSQPATQEPKREPPVDGGGKAAGRTFIKRKKGQEDIRLVNPATGSETAA